MTMLIYGEKIKKKKKKKKNLLLWNQEADDLLVYSIGYSNTTNVYIWGPWVDHDHFYDRVKFVSEYFCVGESLYSTEC